MPAPPRLLVSVRNLKEARAALSGGCDILDVKEPDRGSLGMADPETIGEIAALAVAPLSVALGELSERLTDDEPSSLPSGLTYLKVGLAGMGPREDWTAHWRDFQRPFLDEASRPSWVAVAYADWEIAQAPRPRAVIAAARGSECPVFLLDTFTKDGRNLLDFVSAPELNDICSVARANGLQIALAGSLHAALLPKVLQAAPDIVAIRSAACENGRRGAAVSSEAVRRFRRAMHAVWTGQ